MSEEQLYPMHDKLRKIQDRSQDIYDFLEWLGEQKLFVAQHDIRSDEWRNCGHGHG